MIMEKTQKSRMQPPKLNKSKSVGVMSAEEYVINTVIHITMIVLCFVTVFSFLIIIGSSFQSQKEITVLGYRIIPKKFSLSAYKMIFQNFEVVINSYFVTFTTTLVGTVGGLLVSAGYGYAISRRSFRLRRMLTMMMVFSMLFNGGLVATYIINTQWLGLKDNFWVLVLPIMMNPWFVLIMKSFFSAIPESITEAAKIDGASELNIFIRIIIPMSKPILATVGLFLTLAFWNDYMQSLIYIDSDKLMKLQYLLVKILQDMDFLNSAAAADMGIDISRIEIPTANARMAMCVIAAGPILAVFPFFQKYFVKGMSLGAVKE